MKNRYIPAFIMLAAGHLCVVFYVWYKGGLF